MQWSGLDPQLVWGLLPRFIGFLYVLAFGSLTVQLVSIIGVRGTMPLAVKLSAARRDFPGIRRFFDLPTVFWLNSSDAAIRVVPWLGVSCGVLACYGGPLGYAGLLVGWLLWISVEPAGLIFPWDTMLQEAGFLVLFVPMAPALPALAADALPLPTVAFMFRWLVLRLMLGFAKVKFIGTEKGDSLYLRGFFVWAPLPKPIAWWGHQAPRWFLQVSLVFMFIAEAVAPVLGFFTGPLRLLSFAILTALMLGIHFSGNWGYFNIGYVLLCICLLDANASVFDVLSEPWSSQPLTPLQIAQHTVMGVLFFQSLVYFFVMNTWVTRTWVQWRWESLTWSRPWLRALVGFFRFLAPFRLTNGYGVFPPNAAAPVRLAPVVEGSTDGKVWQAYGYKLLPTTARSPLPAMAPHHPRFDQALHYAALGFHEASFFSSVIGDGSPYNTYLHKCWLERAALQLLEGDEDAKARFGHNPFPDDPPQFVRISTYALAPTLLDERKRTGDLWRVRRVGTLVPARSASSLACDEIVPVPELFHPDFVHLKSRTRALASVVHAYQAGSEPNRAVLAESDLSAAEVERFWGEFIPEVNVGRGDMAMLVERASALRERFSASELYRFERLLSRFAWLLRHRTEPHTDGRASPRIATNSNFRFEMLMHEIIADGPEAYARMLAEPALSVDRFIATSDATQLWMVGLVRFDPLMFHVRAFRWHDFGYRGHRRGMPGLFEYYPLLSQFVPPEEEYVPLSIKHDDGEFTVEGIYAPPMRGSAS